MDHCILRVLPSLFLRLHPFKRQSCEIPLVDVFTPDVFVLYRGYVCAQANEKESQEEDKSDHR